MDARLMAEIFGDDDEAPPSTRVDDPPNEATAPALIKGSADKISSEEILDQRLRELRAHMAGSFLSYGEACRVAKDIHDHHWQQRTDASGKKIYKSASHFAREEFEKELGIKKSQFFAMVAIAEKGLIPDVEIHGIQVAKILSAAPENVRDELRAMREQGASTRVLEAKASRTKARREKPAASAVPSGPVSAKPSTRVDESTPSESTTNDEQHQVALPMRGKVLAYAPDDESCESYHEVARRHRDDWDMEALRLAIPCGNGKAIRIRLEERGEFFDKKTPKGNTSKVKGYARVIDYSYEIVDADDLLKGDRK